MLWFDISDCREQGYNRAGAVAVKNQVLSTQIPTVHPKALYTHWSFHRLNVTVVASCKD